MVRATVAEVKKLWGGTLPANWTTEANVTNLCTQVDCVIDGKTYPDTISTTSNPAKQLANEIVYRKMIHSNWAHAGSEGTEPVIWTTDLIDRLEQLSKSATEGTAVYVKMQKES